MLIFNSVTVVGLGKGRGILIPVFFFWKYDNDIDTILPKMPEAYRKHIESMEKAYRKLREDC